MKPYLLVAFNKLRYSLLRMLYCHGLEATGIQLTGYNTRICIRPTSRVILEPNIVSDGRLTLIVGQDGCLRIGSRVYFNEYTIISCIASVSIGKNCMFGPHVCIYDSDHHFDADTGVQASGTTSPVVIGDGCWIGANAVILKGTEIGNNCVIGAGCIVSGKIPSKSIVTMDRKLIVRPIKNHEKDTNHHA